MGKKSGKIDQPKICQDVVMGPPSESNRKYRPKPNQARKPCYYQLELMFIPAYHPTDDAFIADAVRTPLTQQTYLFVVAN
jgi:hypothetical protein